MPLVREREKESESYIYIEIESSGVVERYREKDIHIELARERGEKEK